MNEADRKEELERLDKILEQIRSQLNEGTERFHDSRAELQTALKNYWEDRHYDFWEEAQLTETIARHRSLTSNSYRRRAQYEKMAASPYFGRIDFVEEHPGHKIEEQVYIGIGSLTDNTSLKLLIYDWRSPIAGMFYDYELGKAEYLSPIGIISGNITLKRQYKIVNGLLAYMFDSDLKIDDEILQRILSKSADEKMRTIVSTIQREQNRVIRDQSHRLLLVQGPAGSGKTSIALHRAAYLLYGERNAVTAKNILVLSPNSIFSNYISGVLPELGEENVLQTTFRDYIKYFSAGFQSKIEDGNEQLEYLLSYQDNTDACALPDTGSYQTRISGISYKSSPEFAEVIRRYIIFLETSWIRELPEIKTDSRKIFTREEWETLFFKDLAYLPLTRRLEHIKHAIQVKLHPVARELRRKKETEIAQTGEEVNEKTIKAMARLETRKELQPIYVEIDHLTEVDPFVLYRRLFEDESLFYQLVEKDHLPEDWQLIRAQTSAFLTHGFISYEDSFPLFFLQGMLEGFPVKKEILHLIIDEAQDYTTLQYEILKRLFPKCAWTILGDPDQSIRPYFRVPQFETLAGILRKENSSETDSALVMRLTRSYRSTREISAFCHAILLDAGKVEHVNRSGPKPVVVEINSSEAAHEMILRVIREQKAEGARSIAVICKTARESAQVYASLKDKIEVHLYTPEMTKFQSGIIVSPVYLAKGLEFDAALVYGVEAERYSHETERNLLYIACTRALHRLVLFYYGKLSPFIADLDKDLWDESHEYMH